jgi:hypothetical protein
MVMPELSESLVGTALRALESVSCFCGQTKQRRRSFCSRCYFALPHVMRAALYRTFGDGYAQEYDAAKDYLRIEAGIQPLPSQTTL